MDLNEFRKNRKPLIVRIKDVQENYSNERPGFNKLICELETGEETFICLSKQETDDLPYKDGYANMTQIAKISIWTKNGKSGRYLERLQPLPALKKTSTTGWVNPWAAEAKKP